MGNRLRGRDPTLLASEVAVSDACAALLLRHPASGVAPRRTWRSVGGRHDVFSTPVLTKLGARCVAEEAERMGAWKRGSLDSLGQ